MQKNDDRPDQKGVQKSDNRKEERCLSKCCVAFRERKWLAIGFMELERRQKMRTDYSPIEHPVGGRRTGCDRSNQNVKRSSLIDCVHVGQQGNAGRTNYGSHDLSSRRRAISLEE